MVSPKASNVYIQKIKKVAGSSHANISITYLRCPLFVGRQRISPFSDMIAKIVRKITGWQGKLVSVGGRATLIKHILQSQPIYLLSAIEPPKTIFNQLESYMAILFWGSIDGTQKYYWSS